MRRQRAVSSSLLRSCVGTVLAAIFACHAAASGTELPAVIRVGVLSDMSGSTADAAGQGSVVAARLAVEDVGSAIGGSKVEVLAGNSQGKADLALSIARQWLDQDSVYAIVDLPYTQVALAVADLGRQRDRAVLVGSATASDLTGKACNAVTTHWTDDTYALAAGTARTLTRAGDKTWFFLTADYAFGLAMQRDATAAIEAEGGRVVGAARHPLASPDMSSFVNQAIASQAQIVGLANVGADTINAIKEAAAFGLVQNGQKLAGLLVFINDVHAMELETAQGLLVTSGFYWDRNDASRRFADRFRAQVGRPPSKAQAAVYAATLHWLRAVAQSGSVSGEATTRAMKSTPADYFGQQATIAANGRVLYDLAIYRVKRPAESKGPWDAYTELAPLPRDQAFRPATASECPLTRP
jgi:branched-chain amino acid transport system substrate-binding protein